MVATGTTFLRLITGDKKFLCSVHFSSSICLLHTTSCLVPSLNLIAAAAAAAAAVALLPLNLASTFLHVR